MDPSRKIFIVRLKIDISIKDFYYVRTYSKINTYGMIGSSWRREDFFYLSPMVGWFEFTITLLLLGCGAFISYEVWKFMIIMSLVNTFILF